jgi:tetratricopeptide (TPR) repeat protein
LRHPIGAQFQEQVQRRQWQAAEELLLRISSPETNGYVAWSVAEFREARGGYSAAEAVLARARALFSPAAAVWVTLQQIKLQLKAGELHKATEESRTLVQGMEGANKLFVLDHLASLPITEQLKAFLPAADTFSADALALQPQNMTLKGTRGAILVELGCLEEGESLLNEVYANSEADNEKGISAFYLGVIAKTKGEVEKARALGGKAKLLFPEEWLRKRVDDELWSETGSVRC